MKPAQKTPMRFSFDVVLSAATDRMVAKTKPLKRFLRLVLGKKAYTGLIIADLPQVRRYVLSLFPELVPAGKPERLGELDGLILGAQLWNQTREDAAAAWVDRIFSLYGQPEGYEVPLMPTGWNDCHH